jgi:hypothetical protein
LTQLLGHLNTRNEDKDKMVVLPKGNVQHAQVVRKPIPKLAQKTVKALTDGINQSLITRFSELKSLGNVYVDPALKDCPLPSQQRSASEGMFQVARGTKLPIGEKGTLRFFIYWKGQDIDLSATLHDDNFEMIERVSYTHLKSAKYQSYHSGDETSARNGASEFSDINIDEAAAAGARYVAMNVLVYSGPTFADHETVYAGWMTREHVNDNEIYEPRTVEQKIDLQSESKNAVPVLFDLVERKAIWVDVTTPRNSYGSGFGGYNGNNVENNAAAISDVLESFIDGNKLSLHELFTLHGKARGTLVESKEEADVVFSPYDGITPYHINDINADFM